MDCIEVCANKILNDATEVFTQIPVIAGTIEHSQKARGEQQVREATGHHQTLVICFGRKRYHMNVLMAVPGFRQGALRITSHYEMFVAGHRIDEQSHGSDTFRTISRTRQGDQKSGPVYGQSIGTVQQKSATTDGFGDDPQLVLNGNTNAVTNIFRATGPGERQTPDAPGELAQRITRCNHLVAGAQPRPGLLANLP